MQDIGRDASSIPHDIITANDSQPDLQIPGQELSYSSTVRFLKTVVNQTDVVVHVGITKLGDGVDSYAAHVQIEGGPFDFRQGMVTFKGSDLDRFVRDIAIKAMRLAEPNILASHLFSQVQKEKCSLEKCNYHQVEEIYDEVLNMPASEQGEWALAGKGLILITQGFYKEAEEQTREALSTYRDSAALKANLGIALEGQKKTADALNELKSGAKAKSKTAENLRLLGDALIHAERYDEALQAFSEAARMRPDFTDNLHDWGEALVKVGRYDDAIEKLSRAVALRPELAPSYVEWGRALERKGDILGAAQKYARAQQLDQTTLSSHEESIALLRRKTQNVNRSDTPASDATATPRTNPSQKLQLAAAES
jgi:tetratricopeptide (TPR) repeat protein